MTNKQEQNPHGIRVLTTILIGVEILLILGSASFAFWQLTSGALPANPTLAWGLLIFLGIFALLLFLAARSLWNFGRFGVSYTLTWQFFQALIGASMINGGLVIPGFIALILAIIMFFLILHKANRPVEA